jgi:Leucine-rich repeat (LRR) protein
VNLSYNALTELKDGAFMNCENLTVLDLSHNQVQIPSSTIFPRYITHICKIV